METPWKNGWILPTSTALTGGFLVAINGGHCFINHFPRSVELSHKHRLCENLMRAQCRWRFRVGFWGGMWVKPTNSNSWTMGPSIWIRCIYFLLKYIKGLRIIFPFAMLYSLPEGTFFVIFLASSSTEVVFTHGFPHSLWQKKVQEERSLGNS